MMTPAWLELALFALFFVVLLKPAFWRFTRGVSKPDPDHFWNWFADHFN